MVRFGLEEWEEWKNAPTDFYDESQSFNGLNQKTSNYSNNIANYEPRVLIKANLLKDSITTQYVTSSEKFQVWDYGTDDLTPDGYTCELKTFNEDIIIHSDKIKIKERK